MHIGSFQAMLLRGLACFAVLAAMGADTWGQEVPTRESRRARLNKMMELQRQAAAERTRNPRVTVYVRPDGIPELTKRPGELDDKPGYTPFDVRLHRISVSRTYASKSADAFVPEDIKVCVHESAERYRLDPDLVYAVIRAESNFNVNAVSSAGARGLMQLMPGTAAEMGVTNIFHPAENIDGGCQYLAKMLELFGGDLRLALAAYNAGPQTVKNYAGVPPYKETNDYIERVMRYHAEHRRGGVPAPRVKFDYRPRYAKAASQPTKYYTIHFKSGLTQPATNVRDEGDYYAVTYNGKVFSAPKELVDRVEEPS